MRATRPAVLRLLALAAMLLPLGCVSPEGATPAEQRAYALAVREEALQELYAEDPDAQARVEAAAGTIFFSNFSVHPGLLTVASGYGIVEDHATGEQTHVDFFRIGLGPGLSVKGFYTLSIVHDPALLQRVAEGAWVPGAFAEAAFVFGDFGGGAVAATLFGSGAEGNLWTHTGFALEATLAYGKVSPTSELNEPDESDEPIESAEPAAP